MSFLLPVILGSVRSDRQGIRAARFIIRHLAERGYDAPLVDPVELKLPLLDRMYKEYPAGQAPDTLERLAELFRKADAFVIVSAEYNHSIPPALSNTLDHFLEEYFFPGGVFLAAFGDRLLFGGPFRRRQGGHAAAGHALRARDAQHSISSADSGDRENARHGWNASAALARPFGETLHR